jgi:uncharacterized protein
MSNLPVVGLYAGLNALIMIWLTVATGAVRRTRGVSIGDGGNARLLRVMRGHANAVENIPITLILLVVAAGLGTPGAVLHGLGAVFTASRALHAAHFTREDAPGWMRAAGFGPGFLVTIILALGVIAHGAWRMTHG